MPIVVNIALVCSATVVAALILRSILARFLDPVQVREAEATADVVMEAMGNLYGVLVAFLLAGAWDRYDQVRETLLIEAAQLADLQQIAHVLPAPTGDSIKLEIRGYIEHASYELRMKSAEPSSDSTSAAIGRMITVLSHFQPTTAAQTELLRDALTAIGELSKQHRMLLYITRRPLPTMVWLVLITGGVLVLLLIAASSRRSRTAAGYLVLAAILVSIALYAIYALSYPVRTGFISQASPALQRLLTP